MGINLLSWISGTNSPTLLVHEVKLQTMVQNGEEETLKIIAFSPFG